MPLKFFKGKICIEIMYKVFLLRIFHRAHLELSPFWVVLMVTHEKLKAKFQHDFEFLSNFNPSQSSLRCDAIYTRSGMLLVF